MHRERGLVLTELLCVVSDMTGLADETCLHGEQSGACAAEAAPLGLTHWDSVSQKETLSNHSGAFQTVQCLRLFITTKTKQQREDPHKVLGAQIDETAGRH